MGGPGLPLPALSRLWTRGVYNAQVLLRTPSGATASLSFFPCAGLVCEQLAVAVDGGSLFADLSVWGVRGNTGDLEKYSGGSLVYRADGLEVGGGEMFESNGFYHQLRAFLEGLAAMELSDCLKEGRTHCEKGAF